MESRHAMASFAGADIEYWPSLGVTSYKLYAQKHDPFLYYPNIR